MLVVIGVLSFVANLLIFYPGYMSVDTANHLHQAKGIIPLTDLQPPIESLFWRSLIFVTGHASAMLIFQLGLLWLSLVLAACYVFSTTKSKKLSLLPIAIGFLPFVVNISGVIWSDNQMAFSLLLAVVLLLCMRWVKSKKGRIVLLCVMGALIFYAALVRYNALPAALPIIFLAAHQSGLLKTFRKQLIVTAIAAIFLAAMIPGLKALSGAQHVTSTGGPMMDDVVHVLKASELAGLPMEAALKESLLRMQDCVIKKDIVIDAFNCATKDDRENILTKYPEGVRSAWNWMITHRPAQYLLYKAKVFAYVLFPAVGRGYIWQDGIVSNQLNLQPKFEQLGEIVKIYVFNFGYKHFSYLYEPWFWLLANISLLYFSRRVVGRLRIFVVSLGLSSVLYILTFIPTGIAADYRYIYWPVLAGLLGAILAVSSKVADPKRRKRTTR